MSAYVCLYDICGMGKFFEQMREAIYFALFLLPLRCLRTCSTPN